MHGHQPLERRRRETQEERDGRQGGDEVPKREKGDASSRLQASEDPAEDTEKREIAEKLKNRERRS
jgi:hypothetical protein